MTQNNKKYKGTRAIFFVLMIALVVVIAYFGKKPNSSETPNSQDSASPTTSDSQASSANTEGQTASPSPSAELVGPDLVAHEPVGDDYFSDAAFMGNSLMDGFKLFSGLSTCDYYTATSMTVVGATSKVCASLDNGAQGTLVDGLTQKPYGKIYILLGINEIGFEVTSFIDYYSKMLDTIIAAQPNCNIYIMGITPVSEVKSNSGEVFNMTRITEYNTALHQLAADKGCYYMDLVSALAGPDGYLPANETTDGVHFSAEVYKTWLDYVKTHYA